MTQSGPRTLKQHGQEIQVAPFDPVGDHNDGTDISSAIVLSPANDGIATTDFVDKLLIQALDQSARFTISGTTPTSSVGFQLTAGNDPIIIPLGESTVITIIQAAATTDLQHQWGR